MRLAPCLESDFIATAGCAARCGGTAEIGLMEPGSKSGEARSAGQQAVRGLVCEIVARVCRAELGRRMRGLLLTGSVARDEATILVHPGRMAVVGRCGFYRRLRAARTVAASRRRGSPQREMRIGFARRRSGRPHRHGRRSRRLLSPASRSHLHLRIALLRARGLRR